MQYIISCHYAVREARVRKVAILIAYAVIIPCLLFSQIVDSKDIPPDMKGILENKDLVVAMTATDQAPFYFKDKNGDLAGFDLDLAVRIAKELGAKRLIINREAKSFNDVVTLVASGKADLAISKLSRTLPRAKFVKYSKPYIVLTQGLLFNRLQLAKKTTEENIRTFIRNLEGKIGVIQKSSYVGYAKENFPKAEIIEYPSWEAVVAAVTSGEILAAYRDDLEIRKVLDSVPNSGLTLKPMYFTDLTDPIAIAVKYDNLQLLSWINIFLEMQQIDMTSEELINRYKGI
jgi:ABC-type amino acid transport substrate-binding protein